MEQDAANSGETADGPPADRVVGRPFQPGQSGNPLGRPKRKPVTELLTAELEKIAGRSDMTKAQKLVERLLSIALQGKRSESVAAMRLIMVYVDGLPAQQIDLDIYDVIPGLARDRGLDPERVVILYDQIKKRNQGG